MGEPICCLRLRLAPHKQGIGILRPIDIPSVNRDCGARRIYTMIKYHLTDLQSASIFGILGIYPAKYCCDSMAADNLRRIPKTLVDQIENRIRRHICKISPLSISKSGI